MARNEKQEGAEKPPCFHSEREYEQWQSLLMRSMEKGVIICDDCTKEYETRMKADGRCFTVKRVTIYKLATKKPA